MDKNELQKRTKEYALRIIKLIKALPQTTEGKTIRNQLIRSDTSVGTNYRAVCRVRSRAGFISKLGIVIEEADKSAFWLKIIIESKILKKELVENTLKETDEITAIMVASKNSAFKNKSSITNLKSQIK